MTETLDIWTINKKRAVMKIPVSSLCSQAGISARSFYFALKGEKTMRAATLAKLNQALGRFKKKHHGSDSGPLTAHAAYKASLVIAALYLKADAKAVIFSDPSRKATASPEWLEAARVRRLGYWIANQMLGFPQTDVAGAAGVTKQAVSRAVKEVESEEDPHMQRVLAQIEEVFS